MVTPAQEFSTVSSTDVAGALAAIRANPPLVHCLTNVVVAQWTANALLAIGAAPAMVDNAHEAADFAQIADGVIVNLGTPYDDTVAAMKAAVTSASESGTPWVLDPVAVGGLAWRTSLAFELLDAGPPAVIRGNASEIMALAGGRGGRGVDAIDRPEAALDAGQRLAREYRTVVAISGPVDHVTDGEHIVKVSNGHPWMTQVTGVGCALGALMAAFCARTNNSLVAAVSATAVLTVVGERAAEEARGPGTYAVALLDQLALVSPNDIAARVHLS